VRLSWLGDHIRRTRRGARPRGERPPQVCGNHRGLVCRCCRVIQLSIRRRAAAPAASRDPLNLTTVGLLSGAFRHFLDRRLPASACAPVGAASWSSKVVIGGSRKPITGCAQEMPSPLFLFALHRPGTNCYFSLPPRPSRQKILPICEVSHSLFPQRRAIILAYGAPKALATDGSHHAPPQAIRH
jgi:hypothetical protein